MMTDRRSRVTMAVSGLTHAVLYCIALGSYRRSALNVQLLLRILFNSLFSRTGLEA